MPSGYWPLLLLSGTLLVTGACASPAAPDPEQATATKTPIATPTFVDEAHPTETHPLAVDSGEFEPTPTPTPTTAPGGAMTGAATGPRACDGLSGELEVQIMVGPAEVVGLEPAAVGSVPFTITSDQGTYTVQGENTLPYQDTLQREWGTYSVSLEMDATIDGICSQGEEGKAPVLKLTLVSSGEQVVEASAAGFHQTYPWSGENVLPVSLPAQEGATAEGEGWILVLHAD